MRREIVTAAAIATVALAAVGCGGSSKSSGNGGAEGIKLGILIPQSGNAATTGKFMTDGAVAAIKQINDSGGIAGRKISYKIYDTVGDPQNGLNAYNRFVSDGNKFAIIGFSAVVTAVGPVASKQDVLLVNSGAPPFDPVAMGDHTIHTLNGQDHEMTCAAQYAYNSMHAAKAGFIYADIAANNAGVHKFGKQFEQLGGSAVAYEGAPQGTTDFRSVLTRIKTKDPHLVYIYTFGSDPGNILKQMQELGMKAKTMGYSGAAVPQTPQVGGTAAEGFIATAGYFNPESQDLQTQTFIDAWKKYIDPNADISKMTFYHATLYDGVQSLATAMKYVKEHGGDMTDPRAVQDAFYKVGTFHVATGDATYTQGNPVPSKPFQVLEVKNGTFVPIDKLEC